MRISYGWLPILALQLYACGGEANPPQAAVPSVTLNQDLVAVEKGQNDMISGVCGTLMQGEPSNAPGSFRHPASRAPDLEIDQSFDGQLLTVLARTEGVEGISEGNFDFESLSAGAPRQLVVARANGGIYILHYWASDECELGSSD